MPFESAASVDGRGIQIRVTDPQMQGYLQRYPFASGPDAEMNRRGLETLQSNISWRPAGEAAAAELLSPEEASVSAADEAAVRRLMEAVTLPEQEQVKHLDDFGWKAKDLPRGAGRVLVIGCGDGIELLFLRTVLPAARITAIDYHDCLLPGLADVVGLDHRVGDMNRLLGELPPEFDLVFSNHTLEHLYAPDELLKVLAGLLVSGGSLVSALPMCACHGMPFLGEVAARADASHKLHPLDAVFLDAGHPWKTNPSDLAATLRSAGFVDVRMFQRREHLCRPLAAARPEMERERAKQVLCNKVVLGTVRRLLKTFFPNHVPESVVRGFFALERRLPFGTNGVMNTYSEEALFFCRRP